MQFTAKALLFDMDGTLIDSDILSNIIWGDWAQKNNIPFQAILDVHHGRRSEETIALVAPHLNIADESRGIYASNLNRTDGLKLIEGAASIFNNLPLDSIAVVTSATLPVTMNRFTALGLRTDAVMVTAESVKRGKPDPEPFLVAASLLQKNPADCLVFEDAPAGIQGAKAAGMQVIALATTHHREQLGQADFIIDDYTKVIFSLADGLISLNLAQLP